MAARFMSAKECEAQILVDRQTWKQTKLRFKYEKVVPIMVKGKDEPQEVYKCFGKDFGPTSVVLTASMKLREEKRRRKKKDRGNVIFSYTSRAVASLLWVEEAIIGRTAERTIIYDQLRSMNHSKGSIILLEGEEGIGKTRLMQEIVKMAQPILDLKGVGTYLGQGDTIEREPYWAFRQIFTQMFGLVVNNAAENQKIIENKVMKSKLENSDKFILNQFLPLLNPILDVHFTDNVGDFPDLKRENTITLLIQLFKIRSEEGPFLIILEDAHLLDLDSWYLVRDIILSKINNLLLLVVYRPLEVNTNNQKHNTYAEKVKNLLNGCVNSNSNCFHVKIQAMSDEEIVGLAKSHWGVNKLPPKLVTHITQSAQGVPYICIEMCKMLLEIDAVKKTYDLDTNGIPVNSIQISDESKLTVIPGNVVDLVKSRLESFTEAEQFTLKVCCVLGTQFQTEDVVAIYPVKVRDKINIVEVLRSLDAKGF
eukprot:TRINITY_DN8567_c0_g2_i18.p1 TRINITY_DN8567_c0_g2~~TRINITY_DN8567_c0_g2_i18.p1  ORF type:complete len:480 (-),score=132.70 TRINITY_DN8567_c0_g2_i18:397-1836(-)